VAGLLLLLLSTVFGFGCAGAAPATPGSVVVVGSWTGSERAAFESVLTEFTDRTGHAVEYIETRDLAGTIRQRLGDNSPLDLAGLNGSNHLAELARSGVLRPLTGSIDLGAYKRDVAPTFVELGSVDERPYGVFIKSSVKGLIWYSPGTFRRAVPATWDDMQRSGPADERSRLWCVGLESGEATGWPGTDWIENILIRQSGPDVYDAWVAGRQPWTSPEVSRAFQAFGQVVADDSVFGGSAGAIETNFTAAGDPLFSDPPGCLFFEQGSFVVPFLADDGRMPGQDFDFFAFPQINPAYDGAVIGGGDLMGMFSANPAAQELIAYLISADGQGRWVATGGGVLSINGRVDDYPTDVERRAAALLTAARQFRFDGSDQMPTGMSQAFMRAVVDFTRNQRSLPEILADLERVRADAY
jgi:alpha-glucoside transport system substrate-binding protein